MKQWAALVGLVGLFLCGTVTASAATYYVDYNSGNDANSGTAKSAPWQHIPGMNGCAGNCASTTPAPGDRFILKGGVTWRASFPIQWSWSGSGGSPIYIGVDKTWYGGASWSRPIFDAGSVAIPGTNEFIGFGSNVTYVTLDNIEMRNFYWDGAPTYGGAQFIFLPGSGNDYITIENCYFHSWSHGTNTGNSGQNRAVILAYAGGGNSNSVVDHNIFDGSPNGTDSMYAILHGMGTITNNVMENMSNGIVGTVTSAIVSGNRIGPINGDYSGVHENCIEFNTGTFYIFNNVLQDCVVIGIAAPDQGPGAVNLYAWNNVIYYTSGENNGTVAFSFDPHSSTPSTLSYHLYNNVIDYSTKTYDIGCVHLTNRSTGAIGLLDMEDNLCIKPTAANLIDLGPGVTKLTDTPNSSMLPGDAAKAGMNYMSMYVGRPQDSTCGGVAGCPVGQGTNLTSLATGSMAALANGTSYACSVGPENEVSCPMRNANVRPTQGAWDAGAYLFGATTTGSNPQPPTGISAIAN